jgi:ATP-dependent Clp endopeptidase proteolytic subunit ClpP
MNKNTWYNMATKTDTEAEISIYGTIGSFEINAKDFAEDLKGIDADTIHLRIDSPGGSVIDGISIFNALQRHPAKVVTHIDSLAASMGSVVAMAGNEVRMANNALLMIHEPWTVAMGNADELRKNADTLEKMSGNILQAYSRSQYKPEEVADLMKSETWMTAQDALNAGFIDYIDDGLKAVASIVDAANSAELQVPTEKLIASMSSKLDAVAKQRDDLSAKLTAQAQELVDARAELEAAELLLGKIDEKEATYKAEIETAKAELETARAECEASKEVTDQAVALKAAEMLQMTAHAPVVPSDNIQNNMTDDELLKKYESFTDSDDRTEFYKKHSNKILRAMTRTQ